MKVGKITVDFKRGGADGTIASDAKLLRFAL
jgi:hypothetical protein